MLKSSLESKRVALTGGLSSGKSTVLAILKELGATVVNADELIHQLLYSNVTIAHRVLDLLGEEILDRGQLNRERIANKVFNNPQKLQQLELLLHPPLRQEIHRIYEEALRQANCSLFVVEIPLYFETGSDPWYHTSLCIDSDEGKCIERFIKKTGLTEKEYFERMHRQFPLAVKKEKAREYITNNSSIDALKQQVQAFYERQLKQK